ncbi:hypothetical protein, partial [Streptomyces flavovirens]|uniref:hypothetical protein n=1 Tax=Streptomyces flavovirens TaxID=52258 RepID=UPI0031F0848D
MRTAVYAAKRLPASPASSRTNLDAARRPPAFAYTARRYDPVVFSGMKSAPVPGEAGRDGGVLV